MSVRQIKIYEPRKSRESHNWILCPEKVLKVFNVLEEMEVFNVMIDRNVVNVVKVLKVIQIMKPSRWEEICGCVVCRHVQDVFTAPPFLGVGQ